MIKHRTCCLIITVLHRHKTATWLWSQADSCISTGSRVLIFYKNCSSVSEKQSHATDEGHKSDLQS